MFERGLSSLLDATGLTLVSDGRKRGSFSFRHFYTTQQIRSGVHHYLLAKNAGTSTAIIDAFYSNFRATEEIPKLTPDWSAAAAIIKIYKRSEVFWHAAKEQSKFRRTT